MAYLTRESFLSRVANSGSKYWAEGKNYRWQYISYAIDCLKIMGVREEYLIEAGTSGIGLSDKSEKFDLPKYDLNKTPFRELLIPIDAYNNKYDCFIALQVWEHLEDQARSFQEVMRISKSAILSFPYRWTWGDKKHRGINAAKIKLWTGDIEPVSIKMINHRAIYVWRF